MTLIRMVLRKMLKNKWFVLFLIIGLLVSAGLLSSIPMYTQGVLQKVLIKELENSQTDTGRFPGGFTVTFRLNSNELGDILKDEDIKSKNMFENQKVKSYYKKYINSFMEVDRYGRENITSVMDLPELTRVYNYSTEPRKIELENKNELDANDRPYVRLQSLSDIGNHITLVDGRLPSDKVIDGVYEVLVSEIALNKLKMFVDKVYVVYNPSNETFKKVKIKPVGVFNVDEGNDPYWSYFKLGAFDEVVLLDEKVMLSDFVKKEISELDYAKWYYAFDYHAISINDLGKVISAHNKVARELSSLYRGTSTDSPIIELLKNYSIKEKQLRTMLWSLNVPVIIVLCLYLFMVSRLIIEKEQNEIALLISRGASRIQVVISYLIEGGILAVITIVLGPLLGLMLCRVMGASNGFLEFVGRKALDVSLSVRAYKYVLISIGIFIVTLIIPAFKESKTSIVDHKRKIGRGVQLSIWEKIFSDIILLAISAYGYYSFNQRQSILREAALSGADVKVDPLLFFVPVLFILGAGLFILRLYPYIIKFIYWAGRKIWPPSIYATLIQVGRSSSSYHFLMIFIMMTLSVGIFSATTARTLNKNEEEQISYSIGADIVLQPIWDTYGGSSSAMPGMAAPGTSGQTKNSVQSTMQVSSPLQYIEPPFEIYQNLPGVQHAAKVYNKDKVWVGAGETQINNVDMMAIDPYDFGNVVWYRNDILPHHINEYLNLLTAEESACLISTSMSKAGNIKVGDSIEISLESGKSVVVNVYGIIDYWPSWNPAKIVDEENKIESRFIVTNLPYMLNFYPIEPYDVWLKLKSDASRAEVFNALTEKKLYNGGVHDLRQEIINFKNSPVQLAINGSLTMGFIICGIICFLGFILYWVLSLKKRGLQFGVLRAMGLSGVQLKLMMIWEQLLSSGIAMISGVVIGSLCSRIFAVFFKMSSNSTAQVPPFKVVSYLSDRLKVYGFIGFTIVLGLAVLTYLLSKIKISNVIKLGED